MDIVGILVTVGIIIGALMVLWGVIALIVFLFASKKVEKFHEESMKQHQTFRDTHFP
jgi:hypothetical protein